MNIFARLRALKSAEDYAEVLPELEAQHRTALERRAALEQSREDALFNGADLDKLKAEAAEADEHIANLSAAIEGATRRRNEAAERARQSAIEARMREARQAVTQERELLRDFHAQAVAIASTLNGLRDLAKIRDESNAFARANGRADLELPNIYSALAASTGRTIAPPFASEHVTIRDYWPRPHPDGSPYGSLEN